MPVKVAATPVVALDAPEIAGVSPADPPGVIATVVLPVVMPASVVAVTRNVPEVENVCTFGFGPAV